MSEVLLPLVEDGRYTLTIQCSAGSRRARDRGRGRQGPSLMTSLVMVGVGVVWLYGLMMGSVMTTGIVMSRWHELPKAREAWSDQMALSAGYRALLFKPMPLVK